MQPIPIRVDVDQRGTSLDPCSRVHYGQLYTFEYNLKVKPFGVVNPDSIQALNNQLGIVRYNMSAQTQESVPRTQPGKSLSTATAQTGGSNAKQLPPLATLKACGFDDAQIKTAQTIVERGMTPRYALAKVRAEALKASQTQAHEVGRLVVGGMEFPAALARVMYSYQTRIDGDDGEDEDTDEDDDDEDEDEDEDEESDDADDDDNDGGDDEEERIGSRDGKDHDN
jgi:hypothetical protein